MPQLTSLTTKSAVDAVVAEAKNLPELIDGLSALDPSMATQITGKALLASKSPWGTLLAGGIAYAAGAFGFGWAPQFDTLLAGFGVLAGAYAMRAITGAPITGILAPAVIGSAPVAALPAAVPAPTQVASPTAPLALVVAVLGASALLAGCTSAQITTAAATPDGQLFCAIEAASGPVVVKAIDAKASALSPAALPVAVIATGAAQAYVNDVCAKAGGIPVSPPSNPDAAPAVAVVLPVS